MIMIAGIMVAPGGYAQSAGEVYLVLGSDTAIWEGMDTSRYHCHYNIGLYTNETRNAYKVMAPDFRARFLDSYGQSLKLTWWMMAGQIFRYADNTDVPVANTMTLHLMKRHHGQAIADFGDELTLHYHTFAWTNYEGGEPMWTQAGSFLECRDDFDFTIAQFLVEEETYPVSFRSGWEWMDNDWQNHLNLLLPFSLEANWRTNWQPYHPSTTNYKAPGDGKGWNTRCIYMASISQSQMNGIFAQAATGTDQVACIWAHLPETDFLTNIANVDAKAQAAALAYPGVKFRYCTAVEAMQRWMKQFDEPPPHLEVIQAARTDKLALELSTDKPIFQAEPFVAFKDIYGQTRIARCTAAGSNMWRVVFPLPPEGIAKVGIAITDDSGHAATRILSFASIPDPPPPTPGYEVVVDNPAAVVQGTWTTATSSSDKHGFNYCYKTQGTGSASLGYVPDLAYATNYHVYEWHPEGQNRTTNAPHIIRYAGGEQTIYVNQKTGGGQWNLLGVFPFLSGVSGSVRITDGFPDGGQVVLADAIKFAIPAIDGPVILSPPLAQVTDYGERAEFHVCAAGSAPLAYQWQFQGQDIPGATSSSLFLVGVDESSAGDYRVLVSNQGGMAPSIAVSLTVNPPISPEITLHPQSLSVDPGAGFSLSVEVGGSRPFSYQWFLNSVIIEGATNSSYIVESAWPSNAGVYRVEVSNVVGEATSGGATVTLNPPAPVGIVQQPQGRSIAAGNRLVLSVELSGSPPFAFQWRKEGEPIAGASAPGLILAPIQLSQSGAYDVVVSNPVGSVTSAVAQVSVFVLPFPEITSAGIHAAGYFQASLSNSPGATFIVEASPDLREWMPLTTSQYGVNTLVMTDLESGVLPRRFYLARGILSTLISDFEGYSPGTAVMFRAPGYSGTTGSYVSTAAPAFTVVTNNFPVGHVGSRVLQATWTFTGSSDRWLRLTTSEGAIRPNPTIDFREGVQFDVYADNPVYLCLGVRETDTSAAIGSNGGSAGGIEWVGGRAQNNTSPPKGVLVPAGQWTTLRFFIPREPVKSFTGDNRLDSTTGKGVLEELAIVPASPNLSHNLYLDNFQVIFITP